MLWCQGTQTIGLSNRKLTSVLKCTMWSKCTPVPDRQTNITAITRWFVLANALCTKSQRWTFTRAQPQYPDLKICELPGFAVPNITNSLKLLRSEINELYHCASLLHILYRFVNVQVVSGFHPFTEQSCQLVTLGHPGLTYIFNFWHSATLALRAERQSARMSEINKHS